MSNEQPRSKRRKQFNLEDPIMTPAEERSFDRVLSRVFSSRKMIEPPPVSEPIAKREEEKTVERTVENGVETGVVTAVERTVDNTVERIKEEQITDLSIDPATDRKSAVINTVEGGVVTAVERTVDNTVERAVETSVAKSDPDLKTLAIEDNLALSLGHASGDFQADIEPSPADPSSSRVNVSESLAPFKNLTLDSTHTAMEQKVYSYMYRLTISKGITSRRFKMKDLMSDLGIGSFETINNALNGLKAKCSIAIVSREGQRIYGIEYQVLTPKEIFEARRQAGIEIDLVTKKIKNPRLSTALSTPLTTAVSTALTTKTVETFLRKSKKESAADIIIYNNNKIGIPLMDPSSSTPQQHDDEKFAQVKKLFAQLSNGGAWKDQRDSKAYQQIAHVPLWHIIMGLCYSVTRSPEHRMRSLNYAVPAILEHYRQMSEFPDQEMLEIAYRTKRKVLACLETDKWTIAQWES